MLEIEPRLPKRWFKMSNISLAVDMPYMHVKCTVQTFWEKRGLWHYDTFCKHTHPQEDLDIAFEVEA